MNWIESGKLGIDEIPPPNGGGGKPTGGEPEPRMPPLLSLRDFLEGFVPPEYLIEGMLQRRFVYALTGQTGHAKTAIALLIAQLVGARYPGAMLGSHEVEQGRVVYFAGENPDDIRMRLIGVGVDLKTNISIIDGVFDIGAMFGSLAEEIKRTGKVDLVIVDTSAAFFLGNEEMSNTQMGQHASMLRRLTTLPGGPCVLVLCHPIKYVTDTTQLLPRGGSAFLAAMDGNLTIWKSPDDLAELHHNKIRGPGFEPMTFKVERITTAKLVDGKGRLLPTVKAVLISEEEEAEEKQEARTEEDQILAAMVQAPHASFTDLARVCGWLWGNGDPAKSKVQRIVARLKQAKLVKAERTGWVLTEAGEKAIGVGQDDAPTTAKAAGKRHKKPDLFAAKGEPK